MSSPAVNPTFGFVGFHFPPMSWVTIARTDLEHYVVAALVTAIDSASLGDTQTDRFTRVGDDVVKQVRMAVASNEGNTLDSDATKIPQSLRPDACWIIAGLMAQGLGVELTDQQANEVSYARDRLKDVARGDLSVEVPDAEDDTPDAQSGAGVEMVAGATPIFTRDTMAGL